MEKLYIKYELIKNEQFSDRFLVIFPNVPFWMVLDNSYEKLLKNILMDFDHFKHDCPPELKQIVDIIDKYVIQENSFESKYSLTRQTRLSVAVFDVTNACSLQCSHCSHNAIPVNSSCTKYMKINTVEKVLDDLQNEGIIGNNTDQETLKFIHVVGGEPLIHPEIEKIFDLIADAGAIPTLITNLVDLSTNPNFFINLSKKSYSYEIGISLDGHCDEINSITRGKGSYIETINNINKLKEFDIPFSLNPLIHSHNVKYLKNIIKHHIDLGCREINVLVQKTVGRAVNKNMLKIKKVQQEVYNDLVDICLKDQSIIPFLKDTRFWYYIQSLLKPQKKLSCGLHNPSTAYIRYNGDLFLCGYMLSNDFKIGNVLNHNVNKLLQSKNTIELGSKFLVDRLKCSSCHLKYFCAGGCRAEMIMKDSLIDDVHSDCEKIKNSIHTLMFKLSLHSATFR